MSYELSLLLNYFVVFIEVLAFMVFPALSFRKRSPQVNLYSLPLC